VKQSQHLNTSLPAGNFAGRFCDFPRNSGDSHAVLCNASNGLAAKFPARARKEFQSRRREFFVGRRETPELRRDFFTCTKAGRFSKEYAGSPKSILNHGIAGEAARARCELDAS
jgi:hypothetical protein